MKVPLYKPHISDAEKKAALRVLESGCLVRGPETKNLEEAFANFTNKKHAVAVSSGTAALHLSLLATQDASKNEVILSPFTFIAGVNIVLYEKLKPYFIDIDPATLGANISSVKRAINKKTSHIILSHVYGLCSYDHDTVNLLADVQIPIIEDACQTLLLPKTNNGLIGQLDSILVYSFADNKIITSGQGGMIAMDNDDIYEKLISLRDQGRNAKQDWLEHTLLGYNYKITELQSAIAHSQLRNIEFHIESRKHAANFYVDNLKNIDGLQTPNKFENRSYFNFFITLENSEKRDGLANYLASKNVSTRKAMPPCNLFGHIKKYGYKSDRLMIAQDLSNRMLELPMFVGITEEEISYVCDSIKLGLQC